MGCQITWFLSLPYCCYWAMWKSSRGFLRWFLGCRYFRLWPEIPLFYSRSSIGISVEAKVDFLTLSVLTAPLLCVQDLPFCTELWSVYIYLKWSFYHLFPTISLGERRGWSDPGSFLKAVCSLSFLRLQMNSTFRNAFVDVVTLGSLIALWPSPKNYFCSVSKGDSFQVTYIKLQFNNT